MPDTIEAEVISIDGKAPPERDRESPPEPRVSGKERVRGMVLRLDKRWWPLWLLLGLLAVVLAIALGLVFGVLYAVFAFCRSLLRLLSGTGGGGDDTRIRRG